MINKLFFLNVDSYILSFRHIVMVT